tara:strand:+ start:1166 stop:2971 length:1806 start_codon:yes stop_codon:yes gene_type:complete
MSILEKLTEGIVNRDLQKEGAALLNKWEKTGLLEGMKDERSKDTMARLLENQAKELLREASSMSAGDVEGFSSVAFPIVRRVFGNLIANDLVSVQPMSLPSGLIFFLDFTVNGDRPSPSKAGYQADKSIYGGDVVAKGLQQGVNLGNSGLNDFQEAGPYGLNNGLSSPTASATVNTAPLLSMVGTASAGTHPLLDKALRFDPDLSGSVVAVVAFPGEADISQADLKNLVTFTGSYTNATIIARGPLRQVRRLTEIHSGSTGDTYDPENTSMNVKMVFEFTGSNLALTAQQTIDFHLGIKNVVDRVTQTAEPMTLDFPIVDDFIAGGALGSVVGDPTWGLESQVDIPEIDIKVDSIAVTAQTKKLKAKWTPELGQDLSAYHNLDAEVELTSILSEQIALEIDREILEDLVKGATASTQYWSRRPGRFLARDTGAQIGGNLDNESLMGADFTGTVSEWYETLAETINDVSAQIHRKTLRGGANFVVCSPEVANILEFTAGFRASIGNDYGNGSVGAVNVGSLSKKFDVYVDPYFPRNILLVGRKGGSFLESGYVYAPYVPLQVTPTIFGVEDFIPRKGVMTRYAKQMVRPDMYGLVIVRDLNG